MKSNILIFVATFLLAFGAGYLIFHSTEKPSVSQQPTENNSADSKEATEEPKKEDASVPAGAEPLIANSCIGCHAVNDAGIAGGTTGPDLSKAFVNVKDKHGIELDEFLQHPTSAVMSGVIGDNPLSDEDRKKIVEFLEETSKK